MKTHRTEAKKYLKTKSRTNFWDIVKEARIPEEDMEILEDRFIKKHSIVKISMDRGWSVKHINDVIKNVYDSVYYLIK